MMIDGWSAAGASAKVRYPALQRSDARCRHQTVTTTRLVLFMEASHNADPREALRPGRDGGLGTVRLARLGARDASLAAIAVAACLEGLLPTVSPSKSPPACNRFRAGRAGSSSPDSAATRFCFRAGSPRQSGCQSIGLAPADHMGIPTDLTYACHRRCHACLSIPNDHDVVSLTEPRRQAITPYG
jgi:hypothetical protein